MFDLARENSYSTPVANSSLLFPMLLSLATQKNSPSINQTASTIFSEYDFVIVGAGAAGATVANRLTEITEFTVLLLEAGTNPPILNDVPVFGRYFLSEDLDWQYKTTPQKHTGKLLVDNKVIWPSGKGIGGSSLLSTLLYARGNRKNYDDWAKQGATGWSYEDVLPYFKKLEDNRNEEFVKDGYHGVNGPITVEKPNYRAEIRAPIFEAATAMGYKTIDVNGANQTGFYDFQATVRNQQRCSTAKAYLVPAENRTNLHILPNAFVTKIIIENNTAVGVSFEVNGTTYQVNAAKEVIMSAGVTNTAQLLMLSGIGPKKELNRHDIPIVADLPVGKNMQDHCTAMLGYELDSSIVPAAKKVSDQNNINEYITNRTGVLTAAEFVSAIAFLNGRTTYISNNTTGPVVDDPNFALYFFESSTDIRKTQFGLTPAAYSQIFSRYENRPFYMCYSTILQPKSRGYVRLNSSNPRDPPIINPNYLAHRRDLADIVEGLKVCQKIGNSPAMQKVKSKPFSTLYPGCEDFAERETKYLRCVAEAVAISLSHQVGTAKMGDLKDRSTVVDPELRVKGMKKLRVVDASVMPIIPSGNPLAPTIMLAEKASDIIKAEYLGARNETQ